MANKLQKKTHIYCSNFSSNDADEVNPKEDQNKSDRISNLPDDILLHIVSLMIEESAAQIRLLSTKWRDLWDKATTQHENGSIYAMAISTLRFVSSEVDWNTINCYRKLVSESLGSGHVLVATMGAYKNLHLYFSHGKVQDDYVNSLVWWTSLKLLLSHLLDTCETIPHIRSIYLTSINLPSEVNINSSFLSLIPSLKCMVIRKCEGLSRVNALLDDKAKLRMLSIIDCQEASLIRIKAYNLKSVRYRGKCPYMEITAFDDGLEDVMLDLREGTMSVNDPFLNLLRISPGINTASYITLCRWTFEWMIRPTLYEYPRFKNLKELWWIDRSMDDDNISSLITFLKQCPDLEKLFVTVDPKCYCLPTNNVCKGERNESGGFERRLYLWLVRMDGSFECEEDELYLADHIINIAENEPIVVATARTPYQRKLVKVNPNGPRIFVKDKDDDLHREHRHMSV